MKKHLLNEEQERIVQKICSIQIESLIRTSIYQVPQEVSRVKELGIDISSVDFNYKITLEIEKWEKIKSKPQDVFKIMTKNMQSKFKHIMFNYIKSDENTRVLWKKLFLVDNLLNTLN